MPNLVEIIKQAACEANEAAKPMNLLMGVVTSESPLVITLEQRLPLSEEFLILTKQVTDHYVDISLNAISELEGITGVEHSHTCPDGSTSNALSNVLESTKHSHEFKGTKKVLLHYGLKKNESVLLIRMQGGQKYIVWDRIGDVPAEGEWAK